VDEKRLLEVPLMAGLGVRGRRLLARRADDIDVPEGTELAREGELAHEFFLILEGTAKVTRGRRFVRELGPGDFFGEIGILASKQRIATVTATSQMELVVLTSAALRSIAREEPSVARTIQGEIEKRLAGATALSSSGR
jgi:CRP-like cAMP-binding protein